MRVELLSHTVAGTPEEAQPEASRRRKKKTDAALTAVAAVNALKGGASARAALGLPAHLKHLVPDS